MNTIIVLVQLGACLGNYTDPLCRVQRQLQDQEITQQQRHNEMLNQMHWDEIRRQRQERLVPELPHRQLPGQLRGGGLFNFD